MSKINERRVEILAKARARKAEIARTAPSENTLRRNDQVRRAKSLLREFILDHGVSIRESGRVMGYESTARLPRHLLQGMITLEDLLAMTEYFEDFDPTTLLRDVVFGVDEHPDEAQARREGTIRPDGERVAIEVSAPSASSAPSAPSAPSPQEGDLEEIVVIQPDAVAPPSEEDESSLDTDEGLQAWASRFGFAM
jgi:hypothetical protein|nr:MAG TPA: hypothetical protein [Caudoviricetes sp.]